MSQEYIDKLQLQPSNCDCDTCKRMCHAPCCGSVEDMEKLIEAGYGNRLMFENLPSSIDCGDFLKPALKGHEGKYTPWETASLRGCTFWNKNGHCELHNLGLKPVQARIVDHGENGYDREKYAAISKEDWESERGLAVIEKWKNINDH
jgi:hypothetical protein